MTLATKLILTRTARTELRAARAWSLKRWGQKRTVQYFEDIDKVAQALLRNPKAHRSRTELAGDTGLFLLPVREHYLVYEPLPDGRIVIVTIIRQGRDTVEILGKDKSIYMQELQEVREKLK